MNTHLDNAQQTLENFLSQFDDKEQERILRYALDHVVLRLKGKKMSIEPVQEPVQEPVPWNWISNTIEPESPWPR